MSDRRFGRREDIAIDAIPVVYTQPQKLTTAVSQNQKPVQQPKRDRRDQSIEQCRRHDAKVRSSTPATAAVFSSPCTLRPWPVRHDAELEQLPVYPRCFPKRVYDTHLVDQAANVRRCLRPTTARSGFPAPIGSEAGAVPTHERLRGRSVEAHSLRRSELQDIGLVPKHKDFGFQRSARPEQPDQSALDRPAKIAHRWTYQPIRGDQLNVLSLRLGQRLWNPASRQIGSRPGSDRLIQIKEGCRYAPQCCHCSKGR